LSSVLLNTVQRRSGDYSGNFYVVDLPLYFDFPTPEYTNNLNYFKLFISKIDSEQIISPYKIFF